MGGSRKKKKTLEIRSSKRDEKRNQRESDCANTMLTENRKW